MDTSPLEEKIKSIEAEIAADKEKIKTIKQDAAKHIDLVKENIRTNNSVLREYKKGLERLNNAK